MATNKHATIRYLTLDKCFRNVGKKYFIEDLVDACNDALWEYNENSRGIEKRSIFEDIKFMESAQGWSIDLVRHKDGRKVYYQYADTDYSINNQLLNELEEQQLKEVLFTLSRFKGMPQFGWIDEMLVRLESSFNLKEEADKIIEFEQNPDLKGLEFFSDIFNGILYKKTLEVLYKGFKQEIPQVVIFYPYYLKQYNNRWFVFGKTDGRDKITNLAIDRIHKLKELNSEYILNESIRFNDFFEDVIGVSIQEDGIVEQISIKIFSKLWPYIETKPLHGSQKVKETNDTFTIISLSLHINYELISLLFSLGEGITVLQPNSLITAIKNKANALINNYS